MRENIKNFTKYLSDLEKILSKGDYESILHVFSLIVQARLAKIRNQIEDAEIIPEQIEKPKKKKGVDIYV
ncbi:MAG TPA: hypothetical protein P5293_01055 [Bacteroidales bacterium]|nr:hypothetical protein [Bacteroidales bacterium]